jgi:hypothetical protein
LVTVAVFFLALPFLVANGYAVAASEESHRQFSAEKNPVVINDESSVEETSNIECQTSEFARKAIDEAKSVERHTWESLALIRQAEAVAEPPECDSLKATSLASEARRLAEENLASLNAERLSNALAKEARVRKKVREFIPLGIFGIFWVLTISYAIYVGYRCVVSEDDKRAAIYSDKLAVVSLLLLCACVLVPFFWWHYNAPSENWFLGGFFDIAEAVVVGFLFAGIPLVTALVASKKAIIRKDMASFVWRTSFVCFGIGLIIVCWLTISIFKLE